jgi:hypothetical protein
MLFVRRRLWFGGALLAACGGDGGTVAGGQPLTLSQYEGSWRNEICAPYDKTQSSKAFYVFTLEGPSTLRYERGHLRYDNASCEGAGTELISPSDLGTVEFWSEEKGSGLTFHRGTWNMPTGDVFELIWALKADGTLCTRIDIEPSLFADASDVKHFLDSAHPDDCYTRIAD